MPGFRLNLLGGFALHDSSGATVRLPTRKAEALLAYLALAPERRHEREALTGLLWGDATDEASRASLRQTLFLLGKALGRDALVSEGRSIVPAPGVLIVDAVEFEGLEVNSDPLALARAADLYQGDLLAGLAVREQPFEEWLLAHRERLRERAIDVLARLVTLQRDAGEIEPAIQTAIRLLALDPLLEEGHRSLMRLYAVQGRRSGALRQYQVCVNVLQRELGVEPEAETRQLYNELLRGSPADLRTTPSAQIPAATAATTATVAAWPAEMPVHDSALVGRAPELAGLVALFDDVAAGHGHIVAVLGEAGIGKTRLTEELAARAVERGFQLLVGHCYESQQLFPFAPWVDLLRAAEIPADRQLLDALQPVWRTELARLLPELAAGEQQAADEFSGFARSEHLFEAIVQAVAQLSARAPLVLVLEDLHWADEMSLRLLAKVGRRLRTLPLLLVATAREEELSAATHLRQALQELGRSERLSRLQLAPLSRPDTAALVQALAHTGADVTSTVRIADRVWQTSEGNPFVVVESMRMIGGDPVHGIDAALALPMRVRDLISSQVERLSAGARALLAVAAVAGQDFDFALLRDAAGQRAQEASEALEELVRRQMLHVTGERFDFTHARIRQTVDEGLLAPMRRTLHGAIGAALEGLYAANPAQVFDRLAYHYSRTDAGAKAVYYLTRFADSAARTGAHDQAVTAIDAALEHLARGAGQNQARERFELVFRKTRSLLLLGRLREVVELLLPEQAMVDASADPRLAGAYYLRLGATFNYLGNYAATEKYSLRALSEATACADFATMGKAHVALASIEFWKRPQEGVRHGLRAVELLENVDEQWWLGQAAWILGLNLSYLGRFAEGLASEERARTLGDELGDRRLACSAAWATGFIQTLAGALDAALSACQKGVELAPDPLSRMTAAGMLALAHVERHEHPEAIKILDQAILQAEKMRFAPLHGLYLGFRGEAALQGGDAPAARALALKGVELTRTSGYIYALGWTQRILGRIARHEGDLEAASACLQDTIATFEAMGAPFETGRTHLELSGVLEAAGDSKGARRHAEIALAALESLALERFVARARATVERLAKPKRSAAPRR
jgi:DNA-binding SARP family transcriptional activator